MAQQTLNNGESGSSFRGKLNSNFTELYPALQQRLYDYVVWLDGTYKARNGATGAITSNAAFHTLMNTIMGSGGSTNAPLRVAVSGSATISGAVLVPSWTDIHVLGTITGDNTNDILLNSGYAGAGNTNIRIFGPGTLNAASTQNPYSGTQNPIRMIGVDNLIVKGVTAINGGTHCINIEDCNNVTVDGCRIDNPGDDGISILRTDGFRVTNNEISGTRIASTGSAGIEVEDASSNGLIYGNHVHETFFGIHIVLDPGSSYGGMSNILVESNIVENTGSWAIDSLCSKTGEVNTGCSFIGNSIQDSSAGGIRYGQTTDSICSNNTVDGCTYGIAVQPGTKRLLINQCTVRNPSERGVYIYGTPAAEATKTKDIVCKGISVYEVGSYPPTKVAFAVDEVENIMIDGTLLLDYRAFGSAQGMSIPLEIRDTTGHIVVTNTYAYGYLSFSSGNTGIIPAGTNDPIIGNATGTWFELTATNKGVRVNS